MNPAKLTYLMEEEFRHCAVKPGETIALLTDVATAPEMVQAAFAAASRLEAQCYELKMNTVFSLIYAGGEAVSEVKGASDLLQQADLILVFQVALGSDWLNKALSNGGRVLYVTDHPDVLERVMPVPGLKEAALYARDLLANARELHVVSDAGTDFRCELGKMRASCQYGAADLPGRIDGWGRGHFSTYANPGTAQGTIVMQPGDCWIFPYIRYVEADTTLTIEDGVIVKVEGAADAALMRQFMGEHSKFEGNNGAFHTSHLGWGLHPNVPKDLLAVYGNDIKRGGQCTRLAGRLPVLDGAEQSLGSG